MSAVRQPRPDVTLVLPGPQEDGVPGSRVIRRAATWALALVLLPVVGTAAGLAFLTMPVTVSGNGVLEPALIIPVRALEAGIVADILVHSGEAVGPGTPLVTLDPFEARQVLAGLEAQRRQKNLEYEKILATFPGEVRLQETRLAQAAASLLQARAQLRSSLVDGGRVPNVDAFLADYMEGTNVALDMAVAVVRTAEADLRNAAEIEERTELHEIERRRYRAELADLDGKIAVERERVSRLSLYAASAGVVLAEDLHRLVGSRVSAGDVLLEVADTTRWRVALEIGERDIHRVTVGDSVRVDVLAFGRESRNEVDGIVVDIGAQPLPGEGPRYRVLVALTSAERASLGSDRLRRGYSVRAKIVTQRANAFQLLWGYVTDGAR